MSRTNWFFFLKKKVKMCFCRYCDWQNIFSNWTVFGRQNETYWSERFYVVWWTVDCVGQTACAIVDACLRMSVGVKIVSVWPFVLIPADMKLTKHFCYMKYNTMNADVWHTKALFILFECDRKLTYTLD